MQTLTITLDRIVYRNGIKLAAVYVIEGRGRACTFLPGHLRGRFVKSADIAAWLAESIVIEATERVISLNGSDRQIAWATDIRARMLEAVEDIERALADEAPSAEIVEYVATKCDYARRVAAAQHDAKWWISRRSALKDEEGMPGSCLAKICGMSRRDLFAPIYDMAA